jgi:hypothetical protein
MGAASPRKGRFAEPAAAPLERGQRAMLAAEIKAKLAQEASANLAERETC